MRFLFTLSFFFFMARPLSEAPLFNFVVWNTGQGSWSTFIYENQCWHFDMGGEKFNINEVLELCAKKQNWLFLSHEDWDHLNFVGRFIRKTNLCLFYPRTPKKKWLRRLNQCPHLPKDIQLISRGDPTKNRNASSFVYLLKKSVLISGDAPISEEKKWYRRLPQRLRLLILGHHGSYTSTSIKLLDWTKPRMTIASARKGKYGHPHKKVRQKLKSRGIPLIQTETHGHIYLQLK